MSATSKRVKYSGALASQSRAKQIYIDAYMSEYERLRSVVLSMSNSRCFDL